MLWDIFCRVIDNFGDIGVCWRLGSDLARRGERVRLWVDDSSALDWMAPGARQSQWPGIQVLPWQETAQDEILERLAVADVWVEAFGCEIDTRFIAHFAQRLHSADPTVHPPVWINLEYLSAERFVKRSHTLPSPVMQGPARGWQKHFFYPGFTSRTGGLIREPDLAHRQHAMQAKGARQAWLDRLGISRHSGTAHAGALASAPSGKERLISLFCYEPPALKALLATLARDPHQTTHLLVTAGRATAATRSITGSQTRQGNLRINYLPQLDQPGFDELLWHCDVNFVRGEDSLVRAIWAGKPLVWHIYPQHDGAHVPKLHAFLDCINASTAVRVLHESWNGVAPAPGTTGTAHPLVLPPMDAWQEAARKLKSDLWQLPDLTGALLQFVLKNR